MSQEFDAPGESPENFDSNPTPTSHNEAQQSETKYTESIHAHEESVGLEPAENHPGGHSDEPNCKFRLMDMDLTQPIKRLEDVGISIGKQRLFHPRRVNGGYLFSTYHADGATGRSRFLSLDFKSSTPGGDAQRSAGRWQPGDERECPPCSQLEYLRNYLARHQTSHLARRQTSPNQAAVFIVDNELDCMVIREIGGMAICIYDHAEGYVALAEQLRKLGVKIVQIVFSNDVVGRTAAVNLSKACTQSFIKAIVRWIPGKRGQTLFNEWQLHDHNKNAFISWFKGLPIADKAMLEAWDRDPEAGLPPEEADEELNEASDENSSGVAPYKYSTAAQLCNEPPPRFLVQEIIPMESLVMLSGRHSSGKSALALDMALAITTGRDWHGHAVEQGPVLYIAAEGGSGIGKRIHVWQTVHEVDEITNFYMVRETVPMHESEAKARLRAMCRQLNTGFALIIIDTLVLCSAGLDENQAGDMTHYLGALQGISRMTGAAILLIHHDNKGGEYRGSTALAGNVDAHIGVTAMDNAATVRLEVHKQKDHAIAKPLVFRRRVEEVQSIEGSPESSFVYELDTSRAGKVNQLNPTERAVLQMLADITANADITTDTLTDAGSDIRDVSETCDDEMCSDGACGDNSGDAEQSADLSPENGTSLHGATAGEWEKACCDSYKISEATFARAKRRLMSLDAVYSDHPGQRGARYLVQLEWRDHLAAE